MPTYTPDAAPSTLSKVLIPVANQGDTRYLVAYQILADSNDTGTGSTNHGPEKLVTELKLGLTSAVTVGAGLVEHPDGTVRSVTVTGAGSNTDSSGLVPSNLAYHHIFKDTRRRVGGHYVHAVTSGQITADEAIQVGIDMNSGAWAGLLTELASGHWYTKTGFKYAAYYHTRLVYRRSRSTGGSGRRLSVSRAEAFLRRHGVTTIPPA